MEDNFFGSVLRKRLLIIIIGFICSSFIFQLLKMQIIEHEEYELQSSSNSIKKVVIQAPRGIFFDRNYKVLVSNKPSYTLQITPSDYDEKNNHLIERVLDVEPNYIKNVFEKNKGYSKYLTRTIKRNVDKDDIIWFEENSEKLEGVNLVVEMQRDYSFGVKGSHIFGYLREVDAKQLQLKNNVYELGDFIGVQGIEKKYENYLKGQKGYDFVLVDSRRKTIGKYREGDLDLYPIKGDDLLLTIDLETQKVAEKAFEGLKGSLVAIEPSTGEIIALVSAPDFSLDDFASFTSSQKIEQIKQDSDKPLFNRATQSIYPPGSTYKMLAALIGLEEKIITKNTSIYCKGGFQFGNRFYKCHGSHGTVNVVDAIEHSCNTFFYKLILEIGLDRWNKYSKMFGFGSLTGFDIGNEATGIVPSTEYYDRAFGKNNWTKGTLISLGIGQGELSVTTLQMAQYASFLANYGKTKTPHLVKAYLEGIQNIYHEFKYDDKEINISKENFEIVREGMFKVVQGNGTARWIKLKDINIAGKTGTSQNPHGKDHALFIAFAPYENPKIAVAVLVENVGFGSTHAAPIARDIIKTYLRNQTDEFPNELDLAEN